MKKENVFIKIWRVIYPVGIYFIISNVISFVFLLITALLMNMDMIVSQNTFDMVAFQEELTLILYKNSMMLTAIAAAITIPIAWLLFQNDRKKEYIEYEKISVLSYGLIILSAITACVGANQLLTIIRLDEIFPGYKQFEQAIFGGNILIQVLAAVILAPVIEELLFRGLVFNRLNRYAGKIPAMLISSVFFGAYHGNMVQGVYAFVVGMLFVFIYDRYKSIFAPILAHVIANLTSILSKEIGIFDIFYTSDIAFYTSTVIVIVLCIVSLVLIHKLVHRPDVKTVDRIVNINDIN
ncbi:MAG: CPBP family intramembrane metalloprotease [Candidatus Galacturonibacter soehngenii]|nr:CPBP family intramembrane metalloprotease [Candidatus Galacturonibacter soehngenii]